MANHCDNQQQIKVRLWYFYDSYCNIKLRDHPVLSHMISAYNHQCVYILYISSRYNYMPVWMHSERGLPGKGLHMYMYTFIHLSM